MLARSKRGHESYREKKLKLSFQLKFKQCETLKKGRMKREPDFPASYTVCMQCYCTYRTLIYRHLTDFNLLLKLQMTFKLYEFILRKRFLKDKLVWF